MDDEENAQQRFRPVWQQTSSGPGQLTLHYLGSSSNMHFFRHPLPYQPYQPYQHVPPAPAWAQQHGLANTNVAYSVSGLYEQQYVPNEAHRPPLVQAEGYRGRSPTAQGAEPQGPSPEQIWSPVPIYSLGTKKNVWGPPEFVADDQLLTPPEWYRYPLERQRRWCVAAAVAQMKASYSDKGTMHRWSMLHGPWHLTPTPLPEYPVLQHLDRRMRLPPPPSERSGSATQGIAEVPGDINRSSMVGSLLLNINRPWSEPVFPPPPRCQKHSSRVQPCAPVENENARDYTLFGKNDSWDRLNQALQDIVMPKRD